MLYFVKFPQIVRSDQDASQAPSVNTLYSAKRSPDELPVVVREQSKSEIENFADFSFLVPLEVSHKYRVNWKFFVKNYRKNDTRLNNFSKGLFYNFSFRLLIWLGTRIWQFVAVDCTPAEMNSSIDKVTRVCRTCQRLIQVQANFFYFLSSCFNRTVRVPILGSASLQIPLYFIQNVRSDRKIYLNPRCNTTVVLI